MAFVTSKWNLHSHFPSSRSTLDFSQLQENPTEFLLVSWQRWHGATAQAEEPEQQDMTVVPLKYHDDQEKSTVTELRILQFIWKQVCPIIHTKDTSVVPRKYLVLLIMIMNNHVTSFSKYLEAAAAHGKQPTLAAQLLRGISSDPVGSVEPATVLHRPPSRRSFQTLPSWALVSSWTVLWRTDDQSHPPSPSL